MASRLAMSLPIWQLLLYGKQACHTLPDSADVHYVKQGCHTLPDSVGVWQAELPYTCGFSRCMASMVAQNLPICKCMASRVAIDVPIRQVYLRHPHHHPCICHVDTACGWGLSGSDSDQRLCVIGGGSKAVNKSRSPGATWTGFLLGNAS